MAGCGTCEDPSEYWRLTQLAEDEARHAALFSCPNCGSLYEVLPEVKERPGRISAQDAVRLFPGAL